MLTATPPCAPFALRMSLRPDWIAMAVLVASVARYIWPRPLMVACQRSSIMLGVFDTGAGHAGAATNGSVADGHSVPFMPSVTA